ncbi:hypothetical protein KC722_03050, partial [Candidatus Kaiserbacteria bacterium]|nr:hypothetical protein [Candidatus Kaiserbacteria bacterium]
MSQGRERYIFIHENNRLLTESLSFRKAWAPFGALLLCGRREQLFIRKAWRGFEAVACYFEK